jgi:hypothetical protein
MDRFEPIDPPSFRFRPGSKSRVSYFYDNDAGHFAYDPGHPMKPFRIQLAHELIMSYGLYRKMEIYVRDYTLVASSSVVLFKSTVLSLL